MQGAEYGKTGGNFAMKVKTQLTNVANGKVARSDDASGLTKVGQGTLVLSAATRDKKPVIQKLTARLKAAGL